MPTYEYECTKCGHHFDAFQKINDKTLDKCPRCNGKVKRLISAGAGIIFKGSGFYSTDYKNKSLKDRDLPKEQSGVCPKMKEGCGGCS